MILSVYLQDVNLLNRRIKGRFNSHYRLTSPTPSLLFIHLKVRPNILFEQVRTLYIE